MPVISTISILQSTIVALKCRPLFLCLICPNPTLTEILQPVSLQQVSGSRPSFADTSMVTHIINQKTSRRACSSERNAQRQRHQPHPIRLRKRRRVKLLHHFTCNHGTWIEDQILDQLNSSIDCPLGTNHMDRATDECGVCICHTSEDETLQVEVLDRAFDWK